jgi:uncharacterized membrane protein
MLSTTIEFMVSILVLSSVFLAGKKNIWAWPLLILGQSVFLVYAMATGMAGFFLLNIGMIIAGARNFMLWHKDKQTVDKPIPEELP